MVEFYMGPNDEGNLLMFLIVVLSWICIWIIIILCYGCKNSNIGARTFIRSRPQRLVLVNQYAVVTD